MKRGERERERELARGTVYIFSEKGTGMGGGKGVALECLSYWVRRGGF